MNKSKVITTLFIFTATVITTLFNACEQPVFQLNEESLKSSSSLSPEVDSAMVKAGANAYTRNCQTCHGELEVSTKRDRSAASITNAIKQQTSMKFLAAVLTEDDIAKITYALSNPILPVIPPTTINRPLERVQHSLPVITNRHMLQSNLEEIFLDEASPDASDTAIKLVIKTHISNHPEAFGGSCSRYDDNCTPNVCGAWGEAECVGKLQQNMQADPLPSSNTIRKGYTIRACEEIVSFNKAITTALSKSGNGLTLSSEINTGSVKQVVNFFYRDRPTSDKAINALVNSGLEAKTKGLATIDQWRTILLPLCMSSSADLL